MSLRSRFLGIAVLTLALSGCSHGAVDGPPTSPSPVPSAIVVRLVITPTGGTFLAGGSTDLVSSGSDFGVGAFAQFGDGSVKYVPATWSSSDSSVIAVDGQTLRAVNRGTAVLTARAEGKTATETFTVEPTMAGSWGGTFVVDQCAAGSGSLLEVVCNNIPGRTPGFLAVGTAVPLTMNIEKNGADLTATVQIGQMSGVLKGTDRGQNFMTFSGDIFANGARITLVIWDTRVKTDVMEGVLGFEVRMDRLPSNAAIAAHLDNVTRR